VHTVSFFPRLPERPPLEDGADQDWRAPAWMEPDRDSIPHLVAANRMVKQDTAFALWLPFVEVHADGVLFEFRWHARRGADQSRAEWDEFQQSIWSQRTVAEAKTERVGVRFADGHFIDSAEPMDGLGHEEAPAESLRTRSGGSGGSSWSLSGSFSAWLWPGPITQPFSLGVQWELAGVPETVLEFSDPSELQRPSAPTTSG
jgi:hypothetical protein